MKDYYKNSLEKIKNFYSEKIDAENAQTKIFEILNDIIPFEAADISFLNGKDTDLIYSEGKINYCEVTVTAPLCFNKTQYGIIKIGRNEVFKEQEITVFETCATVISNIIKEIEMNSIVKTQLQMLGEGIRNKNTAYEKAVEADKIKNKFISNMSHELRSPLNSIIGYTDLLHCQLAGSLNAKQLEYVGDIKIAGIHLLTMVNEILDMSKLESGTVRLNISQFNLFLNIQEALNILKPLYRKKDIKVIVNIDKAIELTADYQKIQQILLNLVGNAIKFTQKNGQILICASKTKKHLTISVKDNGCGIPEKYHRKIFNKFEQISQTANSTGLGLTITKELVKLHNGKISLKSKEGEGAEFIVKIPNTN